MGSGRGLNKLRFDALIDVHYGVECCVVTKLRDAMHCLCLMSQTTASANGAS
jgi:hypothetical protein